MNQEIRKAGNARKTVVLINIGLFLILMVFVQNAWAQTSKNNRTGAWETAATWTGGSAPVQNGNWFSSDIYGYVTRNGNLSVSNGSTMKVYDTLVVKGNLEIQSGGSIEIRQGGVLVVTGNFRMHNTGNVAIDNNNFTNTRVVILGEYVQDQGPVQTGNAFYVIDTTPSFNGTGTATVNGVSGNAATLGAQLNTKAQLIANDPPLTAFVNGIQPGVLPISLLFFKLNSVFPEGIKFDWATASELNFDHFNVQRSVNGKDFETIAEVKGNGTTKVRHDYSFMDKFPMNGTAYYRLQSIDFDGYTETFNVVSVKFEGGKEVAVYPNPVTNSNLNFQLNFQPLSEILVTVTSVSGVERISELIKPYETNVKLELSLEPGIYVVKMTSMDFNKVSRIVVK
jgi:hypothetical protein